MTCVIVTRSDREFSGKSNCLDVIPEFVKFEMLPDRIISMRFLS